MSLIDRGREFHKLVHALLMLLFVLMILVKSKACFWSRAFL